MNNVMGVINVNSNNDLLETLTEQRCIASVPFGGKYRLIDFILSSMANSGLQNVAVFTREKYRALMDHLGSGKDWDLNRKKDGLIILPPHFCDGRSLSEGDLNNFYAHRDFFDRSRQEIVILASGNIICNVNFENAVRFHYDKKADVTVFYAVSEVEKGGRSRRCLELAADGRVKGFTEEGEKCAGGKVLLNIFILSKSLLIIMGQEAETAGRNELMVDRVVADLEYLKVYAYPLSGYFAVIDDIGLYYRHSMELLRHQTWETLFFQPGLIHTKVKDEPPTRYLEGSRVNNSLIANGCTVEGTVENSILFRGVQVLPGSKIKDSIIMQKGVIGERASLERVILDKDVRVNEGRKVRGGRGAPLVVPKRNNY